MFDTNGPTCLSCAKRRCERKEIITEIIETEIKYGRDLRIILEEFYRPMQVSDDGGRLLEIWDYFDFSQCALKSGKKL